MHDKNMTPPPLISSVGSPLSGRKYESLLCVSCLSAGVERMPAKRYPRLIVLST